MMKDPRELVIAANRLVTNQDFLTVLAAMQRQALEVLGSTPPNDIEALRTAAFDHAAVCAVIATVQNLTSARNR